MKSFKKICFFRILLITVAFASNDTNNTAVSQKNVKHAASLGYSSRVSTFLIISERKLENGNAFLFSGSFQLNNDSYNLYSVGISTRYMIYNNKESFLYEGIYYFIGFGAEKSFELTEIFDIKSMLAVGYGWHFLNNKLVFALYTGIQYSYGFWNNPSPVSGGLFSLPLKGGIAYIF